MEDLKERLLTLNKNLNTLRQREARYAGNAPLDLLNQIDDHEQAIELVNQAINGEISREALDAELSPLLIATGDIMKGALAMGHGAQVIIQQAQSAVDEARSRDEYEKTVLAEAVVNIATRLRELVAPFAKKSSTGDTSTIIAKVSLVQDGKLTSSPYKALLDYKIPDAPLFYGRRSAIRHLFRLLQPNTLTIIHAESGSGKSSLLQAGLAARLLVKGHLPLLVRPWNQDPAIAIKRAFIPNLSKVPGLAQCPLVDFLHQVRDVLGGEATLHIFLDQFEEFFTELDLERQDYFVNELADCLEDETLGMPWALALRDEYFGQIANFSPRIRNPFERQYLLKPLDVIEARQVVIEPARRAKVTYEAGLVDRMLQDLQHAQATLSPAELQLVCSALFDNLSPGENQITAADYAQLGRASGILRGHLQRVLQQNMNAPEREVAHRILDSLVTSDNNRALRSLPELVKSTQTDPDKLRNVLDLMVDNRLVRVSEGETAETDLVYELAHNYLITEIQVDPEAQARKAAQELLTREVLSYKRYGTLLDPQKLNIIESQRQNLVLDDDARELLRLSQAHKKRILRNRIAAGVTGFAILLIIVVSTGQFNVSSGVMMTVILLILIVLGGRALYQRNRARQAQRVALARGLSAEAMQEVDRDSELSLILALEAIEQADIVQAESTLREVLLQIRPWRVLESRSDAVLSAAWSPDGKRVVLGLRKGDIQVWDTDTNALQTLLAGHTEAVRDLQFSPSGAYLASASALTNPLDFFAPDDGVRGAVHLWNMASGRLHGILEGHTRGVFSLTWNPDGRQLATASADGTIRVWDFATLKETAVLEACPCKVRSTLKVRGLDWHPGEQKLASCGDEGEVFIWNLETLAVERALTGHRGEVFDVVWHPDGSRLATAGKDGTVRIWQADTGAILDVLVGHQSFVRSARWHPDGFRLASSAIGNNKIIIWDVDAGQSALQLTGHTDWIRQVNWHPNGTELISASDDGTARLWQVDVIPGVTAGHGHTDEVNDVAWHPRERLIASGGKDGTARLWHTETGQCVAVLTGHQGWVWDVAWQHNGGQLATTSNDGAVRVWNVPAAIDGPVVEIAEPAMVLAGPNVTVFRAVWSFDDTLLATANSDKIIRLWDVSTGAIKKALVGHEGGVLGVDFSPDGQILASSSDDETIIIWDLAAGTPKLTLKGHANFVWDVVFSPDGQTLASASGDSTVRLWNAANGEQIARLGHARAVASVAWSRDGRRLAATSDDGVVYVWDASSHQVVDMLTGHNGGVWGATWSPDDVQLATAAADGLVRIFYTRFQKMFELARQYKQRELTPEEREKFMGQPVFGESDRPKDKFAFLSFLDFG